MCLPCSKPKSLHFSPGTTRCAMSLGKLQCHRICPPPPSLNKKVGLKVGGSKIAHFHNVLLCHADNSRPNPASTTLESTLVLWYPSISVSHSLKNSAQRNEALLRKGGRNPPGSCWSHICEASVPQIRKIKIFDGGEREQNITKRVLVMVHPESAHVTMYKGLGSSSSSLPHPPPAGEALHKQ